MPAWLAPAIFQGITGLFGGLFGGKDEYQSPFSEADMRRWGGELYRNYLQRRQFAESGELANALMGIMGEAGLPGQELAPLIGQIGMGRANPMLQNLVGMGLQSGQAQAQLAGPSPAAAIGQLGQSIAGQIWPAEYPNPRDLSDAYFNSLLDFVGRYNEMFPQGGYGFNVPSSTGLIEGGGGFTGYA